MAEHITTVKQGQLKGITDTDLDGEKYYKFLGIPYAKPPTGPLRFKAPQPPESWTGIRDCTKEGNTCLNIGDPTGSEDCLYLNVFTKQLTKPGLSPKPVMAYIHGGAFTMGSSLEISCGSNYLVSEDIVLVTFNYRLGIWGFLSSDDVSLEVPGNAGLKDQTLALKWIKENIASFNGDPNNVTLFGISAGGASVHYQVLSPTAKGLFHKAIIQSGSVLNPWAWGQKNLKLVAEKLGKKVSSDKEALDSLMRASAEELLQVSLSITDGVLNSAKRRPFGPVIEKPNPTAFLTENPIDLMESGNFNQVPIMMGFTSNEGLIYEQEVLTTGVVPSEVGLFWSFGLKKNSQERLRVKNLINNFYFRDGETRDAIHKIITDGSFMVGITMAVKLLAKSSRNPVYLYVFSYVEKTLKKEVAKNIGFDSEKATGLSHTGDKHFIFSTKVSTEMELDAKEIKDRNDAIKRVTKIWADFARFGRPHKSWEPVSNENELKYFNIDKIPTLKVKPFPERIELWENMLKEIPRINVLLDETPENA